MSSRFWFALAVGLMLLATLSAAHTALMSTEAEALNHSLREIFANVLWATLAVAPGFVAGYISKRRPVALGLALGIVSPLFLYLFSLPWWGPTEYASHMSPLVGLALGGIVTNTVGAIAGAAASHPSNKSFKPNPLRGSA